MKVQGDGSCLFTALRLGLELNEIYKLYITEKSTDPRVIRNFSGFSPIVRTQGEALRILICRWMLKHLDTPLALELENSSKAETMRELLQLSLASRHENVNDDIIKNYIAQISQSHQWGSMIEIIGFAMMTRSHVRVWQKKIIEDTRIQDTRTEYYIIDKVKHKEATNEPIDLYFSSNHYDLMVSDYMFEALSEAYPFLKDRVVQTKVQK